MHIILDESFLRFSEIHLFIYFFLETKVGLSFMTSHNVVRSHQPCKHTELDIHDDMGGHSGTTRNSVASNTRSEGLFLFTCMYLLSNDTLRRAEYQITISNRLNYRYSYYKGKCTYHMVAR
jgi:hypothetical protein